MQRLDGKRRRLGPSGGSFLSPAIYLALTGSTVLSSALSGCSSGADTNCDLAHGADGGAQASTDGGKQDPADPDTSIVSGPGSVVLFPRVTFAFESDEGGVSWECSLDEVPFAPCDSPYEIVLEESGEHVLAVRAVDLEGRVDSSPALYPFTAHLPILAYELDGSAENLGTLGSDFDGLDENVDYVAGHRGSAAKFRTSSTSRITIPQTRAPLSTSADYTLSLWFREDAVVHGYYNRLISTRQSGGFESYHGISGQDLVTCFTGESDSNDVGDCGSVDVGPIGEYHHLLYRYDSTSTQPGDAGDLEIFVDGSPATLVPNPEGARIFFPGQAEDMTLGVGTNFEIDQMSVFDRVFSDEEQCELLAQGTWSCAETCACALAASPAHEKQPLRAATLTSADR